MDDFGGRCALSEILRYVEAPYSLAMVNRQGSSCFSGAFGRPWMLGGWRSGMTFVAGAGVAAGASVGLAGALSTGAIVDASTGFATGWRSSGGGNNSRHLMQTSESSTNLTLNVGCTGGRMLDRAAASRSSAPASTSSPRKIACRTLSVARSIKAAASTRNRLATVLGNSPASINSACNVLKRLPRSASTAWLLLRLL
jgi:hypothetical protein